MAGAPTETELKLRVSPAALERLLNQPPLKNGSRAPAQKLKAIYYDTPHLALRQCGAALRVRREGARWIQTLKWGGTARAGLHERAESEAEVAGPAPDLACILDPEAVAMLHAARAADGLKAVFETEFTRVRRLVSLPDEALVEASVDRGEIRSGEAAESLSELELELKRGDAAVLFDLALDIVGRAPAMVENRSKAERGYALHDDSAAGPIKAVSPPLDSAMNVSAGFAATVSSTLAQLQANERGVLAGADSEYLHQMRVGLRRLRSALSVFGDAVPRDARAGHAAELRWLGGLLGPARDWDVFVTETLPLISRAFEGHAGIAALADAAAGQRRAAQRKAQAVIRSRRYQRLVLGIGSWVAAEGWCAVADAEARAVLASPVRAYAGAELERRYQRVRKRGRKLASLDSGELHRLRIAIKKLRYGLDFFAPLYEAEKVRALRSRLSRLQDILGALNDAATTGRLLHEIPTGADDLAEARGLVQGWAAGHAAGIRDGVERAWRSFRRTETFW